MAAKRPRAATHLGIIQAGRPLAIDDSRMRYRRIAPVYDLLELPFEYSRYRPLRRMLFAGHTGRILDAGVGTGRNIPFYPPDFEVTGIDISPEMLARAERRRARLGARVELFERDVRATGFPDRSFDAVVATFLFCVLRAGSGAGRSVSLRGCASPAARSDCWSINDLKDPFGAY